MQLHRFSTPINFITFQVCWFACVMGAANGLGWLGPLLVLVTAPLQVKFLTENHKAEILFIVFCGIGGFILESVMILGGVYIPVGDGSIKISPLWMTALWFNFGPLVSISLSWLKGKYWLAAILGGLAGPVAYWGGERLEALAIAEEFLRGYFPLCILWAVVLPLMVYLHTRLTDESKISSERD